MPEFYLNNKNLKATNVTVDWASMPVEAKEFSKCRKNPIYFIKKYCRIVTLNKGLTNFALYPFQEEMINSFGENRFVICKMPRQVGKALCVETDILTTNGFKKLKDITVGDKIYGPDGKETKVTFITDIMKNRPCYEIKFSNGDTLVADEEHLWTVKSMNWRKTPKILTTKEMLNYMDKSNRLYIDFTDVLEFEEKELEIDPYLLGVWLGDGASSDGRISCHVNDLENYETHFPIKHIYTDKRNNNVKLFRVDNLYSKLNKMSLLNNKNIPDEYLFSSFDQRLSLIRGLMDTDGSVRKHNGGCEFYQKSEKIIDQFRFLLSSLGIKSTKNCKIVKDTPYYSVNFTTELSVFNLPRKRNLQNCKNHKKNKKLYIESITSIESVPVRCLQVDNKDHLFLAGNTLIPTHNTTTVAAFLLHSILFNEEYSIAILANKERQSREILSRIQLMFEHLPKWLQQGVKEWNKGSIILENGSKIIAAATSSSAVRGGTYNLLYLDEFAHVENHVQEEFFTSVYPTISSGSDSKVIITSTPNGMNLFYRIWTDSENGKNHYKRVSVHWSMIPGRDNAWRDQTIANTSERQFDQEFNCVAEETIIKVLDTLTGEEIYLTIEELFNLL